MKKVGLIALAFALIAGLLLAGCSSKPSETPADDGEYYSQAEVGGAEAPNAAPGYDTDMAKEDTATAADESGGAGGGIEYDDSMLQPDVNRKIIYYGTISAQTKNFDEDYNVILAKLNEMGGYVQSSSVSGTKPEEWEETGRSAQMTLRVPSVKFDEFMKFLGGMGETLSTTVNGEDVSLQYFDVETRLKTLRTREDRLEALLEKAETMEDIISLEQALADVSYEIQSLEMNLRNYDSLIDFSSVTITLQEVQVVTKVAPSSPKTLGERISSGFYSVLNVLSDIGEGLLVFLIAGSPVLVPLAAIIVLIVILTKRSRRRRARKVAANPYNSQGMPPYNPQAGHPGGTQGGSPANPQGGNPNDKS